MAKQVKGRIIMGYNYIAKLKSRSRKQKNVPDTLEPFSRVSFVDVCDFDLNDTLLVVRFTQRPGKFEIVNYPIRLRL
jgi:hypothetical protein